MAVSRVKTSSILQGFPKSRSLLAGNTAYDPAATFLIQRITAAGGETSLTFSSIPSTYKNLQVRWIARSTGYAEYIFGRANATGGYANHALAGNSSSASASGTTSNTYIEMQGGVCQNTAPAGTFGAGMLDIIDYASTTKNKTFRYFVGYDTNGTVDQRVQLGSALGTGITTSAITSLDFRVSTGNFAAGSTFALYGMVG
jgi:hypothetical protein